MTKQFYLVQVDRLKERFGEKAFNNEFVGLIWDMVDDLDEQEFKEIVNTMIATRRHTNAPLEVDFREEYLSKMKRRFMADVDGAARTLFTGADHRTPVERRQHLRGILKKEYGVETIAEALQVARLRFKIAEADKLP